MKSYTDIEQSKNMAKILPQESADMHYYKNLVGDYTVGLYNSSDLKEGFELVNIEYIPCWSLAALIGVLPSSIKDNIGMVYSLSMDKEYIEYSNPNISSLCSVYVHTCGNDNLVDACYEMINKLHELNLL